MRGKTWWFGMVLGCLVVAAGVAETVRLVRSGDGGLWFWFPTLVGGGSLIVVGTVLLPRRPGLGCALTVTGCVAAVLPTVWTIVMPLLLVWLAVASARRAAALMEDASPGGADNL